MPRIVAKDPKFRNNDVLRAEVGRQILHEMIVEKHLTTYRAGQQLGFSPDAIKRLCSRYGIAIPERWEEPWATTDAARTILREIAGLYPDVRREKRVKIARYLLAKLGSAADDYDWLASAVTAPEQAVTVHRKHPYKTSSPVEDYSLLTFEQAWDMRRS